MTTVVRGVRGATTASENTEEAILGVTRELLAEVVSQNGIVIGDIASIFFTTTPDITAAFPATAARQLNWRNVALLGAQETPAPGPDLCIRVLFLWNTDYIQREIKHIYLRGAETLRPDFTDASNLN